MQPGDGTQRSMSVEHLCSNIADLTGAEVEPTNLHHAMRDAFGDFASATSLKSLGVLANLADKLRREAGSEGQDRGFGDEFLNTAAAVRYTHFEKILMLRWLLHDLWCIVQSNSVSNTSLDRRVLLHHWMLPSWS